MAATATTPSSHQARRRPTSRKRLLRTIAPTRDGTRARWDPAKPYFMACRQLGAAPAMGPETTQLMDKPETAKRVRRTGLSLLMERRAAAAGADIRPWCWTTAFQT